MQGLFGRFAQWDCLSTPPGVAKTNNPVDKQVKHYYTLRRHINVNMLARELLNLSKRHSERQKQFEQTYVPRKTKYGDTRRW
jgi:hypothetical protein